MKILNKFRQKNKIQKIKYFFFISCVIIIVATLIWLSNYSILYTKKITQEQYESDYMSIAQAYSHVTTGFLNQAETALTIFANHTTLVNGTTAEITDFLVKNNQLKPDFLLNIFYADINGDLVTSERKYANVSDREYFIPVINAKSGEFIVGNSAYSKTSGVMTVHIVTPVFDKNEKCKGLIGGAVELSTLHDILNNVKIKTKGEAFILDKKGVYLSHPNTEYIMNIFIPKDDEYKELSSLKLAQQRHGIYKAKSADKKDVYVFLDPIDQTDWTIGVSVPEEEIFKLYKKLKGIQLTIIFVLIIEILVFIILGVIYITIISGSYDPITNLYNQEKFEKKARKMLKQFEGSGFILIDADLRGFKFINQTYGEEAANQILIKFANLLKGETLKFNGLCAKGYADHFYVFAKIENNSNGKTVAMEKASKSIEKIAKELKSKDIHVVAKYGITFLNSDRKIQSRTKTIRTLIGEASFAKSLIKENVTKAFEIYSPRIEEKINYEHKIERRMEDAVKNDEFFVMYQPKIELSTDKIIGAEALVRWNSSDPELGFLSPAKFIPLFEKNGFIEELDFIVYEKVFKFLRNQMDIGNNVVPISVNMSRNHTKEDKINNFISRFVSTFNKYNLSPDLVEVEIVEESVANDKIILQQVIDALHNNGFSIAMDDFGKGESSLNMLSSIPIDVVKFDQNFLRNNSSLEESSDFITSLVDLGKKLNKKTVFEGVETKEQRDFLRSINCDVVQGYFYSKPLSENDFIQFVKDHI